MRCTSSCSRSKLDGDPRAQGRARPKETPREQRRLPKVESELAATKEYLQAVIAEHGRTNEDLGTANEELVSGNEELQSMNEELETAKEELQSINEELTTVNDELQTRNHEVTQINSDLVNLLTTVDIPVLILDSERRIRRFTPKARRILNVLPTDVGRPFEDIKTNIDVADLDHQIAEVIETMAVKEWEVQDRDGHWYRLQIRPYKATDNRIDGAILSLVDIDALKHLVEKAQRANADAESANHTKDEFLATLSHELRTPLASMLMRAQLLRRGDMEETNVRRAGESIEAGVRMQVQLIDDLLDVSRIASGKLNMALAPIDLATTVTRAVEGLSLAIERKALKLELDIPPTESMGFVNGDDSRLQQVVTNLLTNAIKFTPKLGTVTVSLEVTDSHAVIRVKDTGMGIEAAFLPTVFDRFTQQNSSSTRAYGGLGLGLAIVRHLVELHQGTVLAESPGSGTGATFTVTLPLMKMTPDSVRPPKQALESASARPRAAQRPAYPGDGRRSRHARGGRRHARADGSRRAARAIGGGGDGDDRGVPSGAAHLRRRHAGRERLRVRSRTAGARRRALVEHPRARAHGAGPRGGSRGRARGGLPDSPGQAGRHRSPDGVRAHPRHVPRNAPPFALVLTSRNGKGTAGMSLPEEGEATFTRAIRCVETPAGRASP